MQLFWSYTKNMKTVVIYTDGACKGNPGVGGWAAVLNYNGLKKEIFGAEKETTNNRMELTAVIKALELLTEPCKVILYSDSKYFCDSIEKGWAKSWQMNNWRKKDGKRALNCDLWKKLLDLISKHKIEVMWVKGHAGNENNERCDFLATKSAEEIIEIN